MASIEKRFQAAVNVIKGLPKNGPYQPSTTMMLKFYGYYKQATEGACQQRKPAFWDVIGKAKWDAWNSNRHLSKEQAMQKYVDDLREIIETMSFTENVQNFVGSISGLDNINLDELDMIAPGMKEMAVSHPNSPFNSRTNSPQHGATANLQNDTEIVSNGINGHTNDESSPLTPPIITPPSTPTTNVNIDNQVNLTSPILYHRESATSMGTVDPSDDEYGDPVDMQHEITEAIIQNTILLKQIQLTIARMNADITNVNRNISTLEKSINDVRTYLHKSKLNGTNKIQRRYPRWWPFDDISPAWFIFLILWPFMVNRLSRMLLGVQRRK